jgi:hypothetical protein
VKIKQITILGDVPNRAELLSDMIEIEAEKLGVAVEVTQTNDPDVIEKLRVMRTPAIAVDGAVRLVMDQSVNNLPDAAVIRGWLMR